MRIFKKSMKHPRRGEATPLDQPVPLSEDVVKRFKEDEGDRSTIFESSLRQLEYNFARDESERKLVEAQRDEAFKQSQFQRRDVFETNEKDRIRLFKETDAEQEATFRLSEGRHIGIFNRSQEARTKRFYDSLERSDQTDEELVAAVESLYLSGRRRRQDIVRELLEVTPTEFDAFLRSVDASFTAISPLFPPSDGNRVTPVPSVSLEQLYDDRNDFGNPPSYAESQTISSTLSSDNSLSETTEVTSDSDGDVFELPPVSDVHPVWEAFDSLFQERGAQRDAAFKQALESHEASFQAAEQKRNAAIQRLDSRFCQDERVFEAQFISSQNNFASRFGTREKSRDDIELRRDKVLQSSIDSFQDASQQRRSFFTKRIKALDDSEDRYNASLQLSASIKLGVQIADGGGPYPESSGELIRPVSPVISIRVETPVAPGDDFDFGPRTLLRRYLPRCLPIPQPRVSKAAQIDRHLEEYDRRFNQEEERRRKDARNALEKWQQIFSINEVKRQEKFRTQQANHAELSEKRERNQTLAFTNNQLDREKHFIEKQALREKTFANKEDKRAEKFEYFLREWRTRTEDVKARTLPDARKWEAKREQDLIKWATDLRQPISVADVPVTPRISEETDKRRVKRKDLKKRTPKRR